MVLVDEYHSDEGEAIGNVGKGAAGEVRSETVMQ
jgi:hypothetical protein